MVLVTFREFGICVARAEAWYQDYFIMTIFSIAVTLKNLVNRVYGELL